MISFWQRYSKKDFTLVVSGCWRILKRDYSRINPKAKWVALIMFDVWGLIIMCLKMQSQQYWSCARSKMTEMTWCEYLTVSWSKAWSQHLAEDFSPILKMKLNMLVYDYSSHSQWVHTSLLSHTLLPFSPFTQSLPHLSDKSLQIHMEHLCFSRNPSWTLFCQHLNLYNLMYPT